jgi:hypothetical protein
VGVLNGAGDTLVVPAAAEGVHEAVVLQVVDAVRVRDGDGLAVDVDAGDPRELQFDAGAREHLAEGAGPDVLADRQLVHTDTLDEVGLGVDKGDGDVLAAQPPGETSGSDGSGVPGSEDDDAVLHFPGSCLAGVSSPEPDSPRIPDRIRCEAPHIGVRRL